MRPEPAPAVSENPAQLRPEALRRLRGASESREAQAEEAQEQRGLQGGRTQGHNREGPRDGGQVRSPVRHDNHKQRDRPSLQPTPHRDKLPGEGTPVGARVLGAIAQRQARETRVPLRRRQHRERCRLLSGFFFTYLHNSFVLVWFAGFFLFSWGYETRLIREYSKHVL